MPHQVTRLVTIAFFASLAACSTVTTTGVKNTSKTFNTVVVDAGHGGKDSGAYRRYGPPEKAIALDVAQRLNKKLRESQLKTVMTRDSDVFIELNDRVAIENKQKNAIFVSIHFNEGNKTRDWEYRELLADRIAEAIVEQRFGSGVYRASSQVAQSPAQPESPSGGTGLAPSTGHR